MPVKAAVRQPGRLHEVGDARTLDAPLSQHAGGNLHYLLMVLSFTPLHVVVNQKTRAGG